MNEIIKSLYDRKSVRVYEDRPIPEKMKQIILEAAAQAPSAGCQQLYTILDITDQKLKDELVKTCDNQPFIATAPMVLVFCADCKKWYDAYLEAGCSPRKPGVGDLMLAVNRRYGRTDYLPCIAWGSLARRCAELAPGNRVELEGRLQSRVYTKRLGETSEERTAFEVSVSVLERLDAPAPAEQPCG